MSRLKSLLSAGLLGSLLSFSSIGAAFAQTAPTATPLPQPRCAAPSNASRW